MRNELVFSFIRFWGKYEKTLPIEQVSSMGRIGQFYRMRSTVNPADCSIRRTTPLAQ